MRDSAERLGRWLAILTAADVAVGAIWAAVRSESVRTSITGALFLTGGVVFVGAAFTGGGVRGRIQHYEAGGRTAQEMPFLGVLVGLALMGLGVVAVVA